MHKGSCGYRVCCDEERWSSWCLVLGFVGKEEDGRICSIVEALISRIGNGWVVSCQSFCGSASSAGYMRTKLSTKPVAS
jgi:hypothetical protein